VNTVYIQCKFRQSIRTCVSDHSPITSDVKSQEIVLPEDNLETVFRLDALAKALSVIATATWLAGWLGG